MRLIKLKVKNIASLKGEHIIDFAQIQGMSPLFAITGETGSGKSSILNSIGLVLYGKVYKAGVTQLDLVTLGEKEGQIELVFQAQGKNYLALWRAKVRKQNGEYYSTPQTPQRELYSLEGEDFESAKTILTTRTEELLNLDFDQFCKCIILNQGEFARFLSSSFTERKEILEKLYPGEMLESLSRELKSELDGLQKKKNDLDIELAALQGDGPQGDELTLLKEKLEKEYKLHENWLGHLEKTLQHFSSLYTYHSKFLETRERIEVVKKNLAQETTLFNEFLTQVQKASSELILNQAQQEKELPRLQELLKVEESLKLNGEQKLEQQKQQTVLEEQLKTFDLRLKQLKSKKESWELRSQELTHAFVLPLNELKKHSKSLEFLFEHYSKLELLEQELTAKEERLQQLEVQGKEDAKLLQVLKDKKSTFSNDKALLQTLEDRKKELTLITENRQRALMKQDELQNQLKQMIKEQKDISQGIILQTQALAELRQEYLPLETTIKLQGLLSAVEICLTHPQLEEEKACPVCKTDLKDEDILKLKNNLEKTDFTQLRQKEETLARQIIKKESEIQQLKEKEEKNTTDHNHKNEELKTLKASLNTSLPSMEELELQLKEAQKRVWEQEKLLKDEQQLDLTLSKTREQYLTLKNELLSKSEIKKSLQDKVNELVAPLSFISELSSETITLLKAENKKLALHLELETEGIHLTQEQNHLNESMQIAQESLKKLQLSLADLTSRITSLSTTLEKELQGKKAIELIQSLSQRVKEKLDQLALREREQKSQELKLKESQSRVYTLEELIKDIDLQFTKENHTLRELSKTDLTRPRPELSNLMDKLSNLFLELTSPEALFIPLKELIESQKTYFKDKTSELKMSFASVRARLEDWEKRQDRIVLLQLKSQDLTQNLERRARLYEVLGKDELRTFVLSLVEENLITQTNEELGKLCQGRYEIVHQSRRMKLAPEFYIQDKYREGGLRKVSTLSGGETFMVSLAMALGLAEMTRGKAEIDTLFIDEGFGTLDQESLEDVLDMLKQIQNRGLMVGIISHVKALTHALPINLLVSKKQDGTSGVGLQYN